MTMSTDKRQPALAVVIAGLVLGWTGLAWGYIQNRLAGAPVVLIAAGGVLVLTAGAVFLRGGKALVFRGLSNVLRRAVLLAGLALALVLGNVWAVKNDLRWDLTLSKQHTLTERTRSVLRALTEKITITVFYVGHPPNYLADRLREFERHSGGTVETEIVDPLVRIGYAAQFGRTITADEKKAVVRTKDDRRDIGFKDGPLTEEALLNALVQVVQEPRDICFLGGHGEYPPEDESPAGLSRFAAYLATNRFQTREVLLGQTGKVPDDCQLLIVAGPANPVPDKEQDLLRGFLKKGGDALFLIEAAPVGTEEHPLAEEDKMKNPALNGILGEWGIMVGDDLVIDRQNYVGQDIGCPATNRYPEHEAITEGLDYTFFIRPRSVTIDPYASSTAFIAPLVLTSSEEQSWAETNKNLNIKFDKGEDLPGPVPVGAVVWEPKRGEKISETRLIVITDADFISNRFIDQYSNAELILNSVQWLTNAAFVSLGKDDDIRVERLDLTSRQLRVVSVLIWSLPAAFLFTGLWVLRERI